MGHVIVAARPKMIDRELYRTIPIHDRRITLCGSTRFRDAFDFWNTHLTLAGNVVYSVALDAHGDVRDALPSGARRHSPAGLIRKFAKPAEFSGFRSYTNGTSFSPSGFNNRGEASCLLAGWF